MRISDWRSDVCSSDLDQREPRGPSWHAHWNRKEPRSKRMSASSKSGGKDWKRRNARQRSEEHTSELQSLMRISYAVFCLKKKNIQQTYRTHHQKKQNQTDNTTQDITQND